MFSNYKNRISYNPFGHIALCVFGTNEGVTRRKIYEEQIKIL